MLQFEFSRQKLEQIEFIMDLHGPRCALEFFRGNPDYICTEKFIRDTEEVEDFAIAFYTQFNETFGVKY